MNPFKTLMAALVAAIFSWLAAPGANAQVFIVASCGTVPASQATLTAGRPGMLFIDTTGVLCTSAGGGGGGDATAANQALQITQETAINTVLGTVAASPTANTIADRLKVLNTTLGTPFQAGGSIGNTTFAATQSGAWNITNVTGTVSLPTGASTAAKQPALGTAGASSTDVLSVQGIASGTPLPVGGTLTGVTTVGTVTTLSQFGGQAITLGAGAVAAGTLRITQASDSPEVAVLGSTGDGPWSGSGNGTNNAILKTIATNSVATATNVAITDNPVNLGFQAIAAENAVVTATRKVQGVADLTGRQIMLPYANLEYQVQGTITSAMTGTTSTSLVAAPGAGLRNYITTIICSNAHATVGTDIILQDGSGGTTFGLVPAAATYGGAVVSLPMPLRQPTANTALFVANVTTGASTKCTAVGFKSAV